jgi:hypothetical protein
MSSSPSSSEIGPFEDVLVAARAPSGEAHGSSRRPFPSSAAAGPSRTEVDTESPGMSDQIVDGTVALRRKSAAAAAATTAAAAGVAAASAPSSAADVAVSTTSVSAGVSIDEEDEWRHGSSSLPLSFTAGSDAGGGGSCGRKASATRAPSSSSSLSSPIADSSGAGDSKRLPPVSLRSTPDHKLDHRLDQDQKRAVDLVLTGRSVFITGVAGTGKVRLFSCAPRVLSHSLPFRSF